MVGHTKQNEPKNLKLVGNFYNFFSILYKSSLCGTRNNSLDLGNFKN